ncbi:MAG: hypothetical protein CSA84_01380 [Actinomycetales bacterium]|nr:MAG: hypothetical protein CSA84_01380 [Actinomycetales bacterium]
MPRPAVSNNPAATSTGGSSKRLLAVLIVLGIVVAIMLAVLIGGRNSSASDGDAAPTAEAGNSSSAGQSAVPQGALGFGEAMVVGQAREGAPTLDIYEDPQCPMCGRFEAIFGETIRDLVESGEARVQVHTMSFLDVNLRNDSSRRAANAMFCAADQGAFAEYETAVFQGQPAREGSGWTDAQLEQFATDVGLQGSELDTWRSCQESMKYLPHVEALQEASTRNGVRGTPTVHLNGAPLQLGGLTPELFRQRVLGREPAGP